jgi:hypothetical protein
MYRWLIELWPLRAEAIMPIGPTNIIFLIVVIAAAYPVAVIGVANDRRGDVPASRWPFSITFKSLGNPPRPFASPAAAQLWMEWRERGIFIPSAVAAFALMLFLFRIFGVMNSHDLFESIAYGLPLGIMYLVFLVGMIGGAFNPLRNYMGIDSFRAVRPLSDTQLAGVVLKNGTVSLLAAYAVYLLAVLVVIVHLYVTGQMRAVEEVVYLMAGKPIVIRTFNFIMIVVGWPFLSWCLLGLGISVGLTGRFWMSATILIGSLLTFFGLLIISLFIDYPFGTAFFYGLGATGAGAAVCFYVASLRKRLIRPWIPALALTGGIVFGIIYYKSVTFTPWMDFAATMGLAALLLSPPAAAPLALYWNRHR